jgi:predicted metal-dependent hydrolase
MDQQTESITWPPVYKLKKHRRARHVKLRTSRLNGLEITVPYRFNQKELPAILEEHRAWIVKQLLKMQADFTEALPDVIHFPAIHTSWSVRYISGIKRMQLIESALSELTLIGKVDNKPLAREKLTDWARKIAKEHLPSMLDFVSRETGIGYEGVSVRDQKTQWGSCTASKIINLNYRLIFLPRGLVRHIMVHELCHTVHLNHSKRFWALVAKHDPTWMENKRALRQGDRFVPAWL